MMKSVKRSVLETENRGTNNAEAIVQVHRKDPELKGAQRVILRAHFDSLSNKQMEGPRTFIIDAKVVKQADKRLEASEGETNWAIGVDQTLRMAIGLQAPIDRKKESEQHETQAKSESDDKFARKTCLREIEVIPIYSWWHLTSPSVLRRKRRWPWGVLIDKALGLQYKIVRVDHACMEDMESYAVRVTPGVLSYLGVRSGDSIRARAVVQKKEEASFEEKKTTLRALELTPQLLEERERLWEASQIPGYYHSNPFANNRDSPDLPMVFMDAQARDELGVKPGDTVYLYRNNPRVFVRELTGLILTVALALPGLLRFAMENKWGYMWIGIGLVFVLGLFVSILLSRRTIRA